MTKFVFAFLVLASSSLAYLGYPREALAVGFVECKILGSNQSIVVQGDSCPSGTYFVRFL